MSVKHQLMVVAAVLLAGALINSGVVLYRLSEMSADARVVNHAGIVRGATQRLVKREIEGDPSDDLMMTIENIIEGLQSGSTDLRLPRATDSDFQSAMENVHASWSVLKRTIVDARSDDSLKNAAYMQSEDFFVDTDAAVTAAEVAAAGKVTMTRYLQIILSLANLAIVGAIVWVTRKMTLTLHENISTLAETSTQIAATAALHERIATDQATAMNETTTTMKQLGQSSRLAAGQAETGAKETSQSLSLAEDGTRTVQQTVDAMSDLQAKVNALSQEILALSDRINQIEEISSFVGDLASQTNMLAMNAAVEAAHAGDQGKGFAVVATEIRKLANQSSKSVSRIHDLVADIQQATNSSVMATEEGTSVVGQAMMLCQETADVFNNLGKSIGVAEENVQQLSLNNREQASAINQVVEAVESLNEGAQEASNGLKETSEGLHTLNQAIFNLQSMIGMTNTHLRR